MSFPSPTMLAVYDGQRCLGHIIARGKTGFEAFDADDRSVGIFRTSTKQQMP